MHMVIAIAFWWLGADPDWVQSGGKAAKYPQATHLVGFGAAADGNVDAAKSQAAAQVAQQISVRIESEQSDVSAEKNGKQSYAIAAFTRATTDVRVAGLRFETHVVAGKAYALAVVARSQAAADARADRDRALLSAKDAYARGEKSGAEADAMRAFLAARTALAEALDAEAVVRVLAGGDAAFTAESVALNGKIDEQLVRLAKAAASTLADAVGSLALQLSQQGVATGARLTIAPLTYGVTSFSSVFGRQVAGDLESKIAAAKLLGPKPLGKAIVMKGTYAELDDAVRIVVIAREVASGVAVASAEASVKKAAVPKDLSLVPQNLQQALVDQKILAQGEQVSGDLRVEVWTSKGASNLVFQAKEEVKLLMRVNKPCYVRLVYLLASGAKVPLAQAYYIDQSKVNFAVEYPDVFEVTAPFGIERLHAVAFTEKPEPLPTVPQVVQGEKYDVVTETAALVKHRGLTKKKAAAETAEAMVTLTTMP